MEPKNNKPITVLITCATGLGYPSYIKCLDKGIRKKARVIGTASVRDAVGFAFVDKGYCISQPDDSVFIKDMLSVCLKEKVKVLIPTAPKELMPIASNIDKFQKIGTSVLISSVESLILSEDKNKFFNFCKKINIPTPNFFEVSNYKELKEAIIKLGYPEKRVCFKPAISSGSRGFRILADQKNSLRDLLDGQSNNYINMNEVLAIFGKYKKFPELLAMEYLPGDEYSVDVLAENGKSVIIVPRLRTKVVLGSSFGGVTVNQKEIIKYSKEIISRLHLNGIVGVQFKISENKKPKVLEVNPRINGCMVLSAAAGANILEAAVTKELYGKFHAPKIKWGTKLIRYYEEVYQDKNGKFFRF